MTKERDRNAEQNERPRKTSSNGAFPPGANRADEAAQTSTQDRQAGSEEELKQELADVLRQWDARIEPALPPLAAFEQLVGTQRARSRTRLWRDLLVFWAVAAFVLATLVLVVQSSLLGFVILQATVFVAAIAFVATGIRSKEGTSEWRS
ncbi:YxlC family protein [Paenibacillus aurantiacus]|uniref:YxlC family protein n=1 Tax=Paenibacillus aurantiacus TaxID=1936118 RepID=A0ABV5KQT2_9BACL